MSRLEAGTRVTYNGRSYKTTDELMAPGLVRLEPIGGGRSVDAPIDEIAVVRARLRHREDDHHEPIYEDAERSWTPEQRATDEQMNTVLEILMERGSALQSEIAEELGVRLELKLGTARAATSASLLYFREAGWVEFVRREGQTRLWRLLDR